MCSSDLEMKAFCKQKGIRLDLASVAHPQSNGQAERMNQIVLAGIKPRLQVPLERTPGCWLDELPAVLWGIRTTPNRSTGYTPFFMVYGAEAVMPTDLEHDSPRFALYNEEENEEARLVGVDLLEEARELALSRTAIYQQSLRRSASSCFLLFLYSIKASQEIFSDRKSTRLNSSHITRSRMPSSA